MILGSWDSRTIGKQNLKVRRKKPCFYENAAQAKRVKSLRRGVVGTLVLLLFAGLLNCDAIAAPDSAPKKAGLTSVEDSGGAASEKAARTEAAHGIAREMEADQDLIETILEVRLGSFVLSEGAFGYLDRRGVLFLPMRDFMKALEFPIDVDSEGRRASGWFLRENRLFTLNLDKGEVIIDGARERFDPTLVRLIYGDLFVDVRLLAKWFPVDIDYDLANLLITLHSREPLPLEDRLSREERRAKALGRQADSGPKFERVDTPYAWVGWPSIDTSLEFGLTDTGSSRAKSFSHSTIANADVGKMHGNFYVAGSQSDAISNARMTLSRKDADGGILGAFDATEVAAGDVVSPQIPLVSKTELGRGAMVSNFPIGRATEFDRITLDGDLASGWEVELYRNEVLLTYQQSRSDGRYVFEDVPLLFGVNNLRLVFYGPQGQVRQEVRQVRIGPGQVRPGEVLYRFAANEHKQTLFELEDTDTRESDDYGRARMFGEVEAGINRNISVAARMATLPHDGDRHTYFGGGTRLALGPVFGGLDATADSTGGWAAKTVAQTAFMGMSLTGEHDRFFNFISEQTGSDDDPLRHRTEMRLEGVAHVDGLPHVPFSISNRHDVLQSGDSQTSLDNRLSTAIGRASYTNTLNWRYDRPADAEGIAALAGNFLVGGRAWNLHLRGRLGYDLAPESDLTSGSVMVDWRINADYNAEFGIDTDLTEEGTTTFRTGINTRFEHVSLGAKAEYDTGNEFLARLTVSFSAANDPRAGFNARSGNLARSGLVSARVYRDNNFNHQFDDGDEPLKGVRFLGDRSPAKGETGADGIALVSDLSTDTPTDFVVDMGSIEDPFSVSDPEGVSIALRPGTPAMLDFPVVSTGEIDGIVYRREGEWSKPVSDVILQLVNARGAVVRQTKSAFDGFYLFSYVRPGTYTLRTDPEQAARLELKEPKPRTVSIEADGTVISAQDFVFEEGDKVAEGKQSFRVRLAVFTTRDDAGNGWAEIVARLPDVFTGLEPNFEAEKRPGGGDDAIALLAAGLPSRDAASDLCDDLRKAMGDLWCNPLKIEVR